LVTEAKLQTFRENGDGELVVETPQCVHDRDERSVSSAAPLHAQTADGKFLIEGEGFLWLQTNSSLTVSNRVHTTIHADLLQLQSSDARSNAATQDSKGIEIFADRFEYAASSGEGIYIGNVHVAGTNLSLTAGRLTVAMPTNAPGRPSKLQTITAETNVVVDYTMLHGTNEPARVHATGEEAIYTASIDQIRVTGHPTWRVEQREGRGDELLIDRANKIFLANGHAWLKMPAQNMDTSGFFPRNPSNGVNSVSPSNSFVEIVSDSHEILTNSASFRGAVHVIQREDARLKGTMDCGVLTVAFSGTNELQSLVAEPNVVIQQDDRQLSGGRAVYTGASWVLALTEHPAWRDGLRSGKGDLLRVIMRPYEMIVTGNATMRLPADEFGPATIIAADVARTNSPKPATRQFADISADEYSVTQELALFRRNVRIDHPQMNWVCGKMTAQLPPPGEKRSSILAEQAVAFDLVDDHGQKVHGTCEKAVYTYDSTAAAITDLIKLTGNPTLQTTNGTFQNPIIILDRANHKLIAPGKYKLAGSTSMARTNQFLLPKKKIEGHT